MIRLTQDYILVRPIKRQQSAVLEVVSHEKLSRGLVIAVGPGKELKSGDLEPMGVIPGDWVCYVDLDHIYKKYFEDGVEYRVMQDKDIACVGERDSIDPGQAITDAEAARLIAFHNPTSYIRAA